MKRLLFTATIIILLLTCGLLFAAEEATSGADIIYTKPVKSVIFSHKVHVEQKGLSCGSCHSGLFEPKALSAQKKDDFNMSALYQGKYCGACHDGKAAFASNSQCARCHMGAKGHRDIQKNKQAISAPLAGPDGIVIGKGSSRVNFNHKAHSKRSDCSVCHSGLFPMKKGQSKIMMDDLYKGKFCGECHNGKKAFQADKCSSCHEKTPAPHKDLIYKPEGIGPVKFNHVFHANAFSCNDCHGKLFKMQKGGSKINMDDMYAGKSCGACHNGKAASAVMDCAKCHK